MKAAALLVAAALAGCGQRGASVETASARPWRSIATAEDRTRIREWRGAWIEGLRQARAAGHGAAIAAEGALLAPDAALAGAALPDGSYQCRVLKLGSQGVGGLAYVPYPAFECRVRAEAGRQHFTKLAGSQRPVGHVHPDGDARGVFLGTLMLGDEGTAMRYGRDRTRDMAGIVERVGPRRWRIVLPRPRFESIVDVIELVPVAQGATS